MKKRIRIFLKIIKSLLVVCIGSVVINEIRNLKEKNNNDCKNDNVKRKRGFYEMHVKRPIDFTLSLIGFIVLFPLMIVVTLLVRIKLGSPVFFVQERPGLDEKIFKMYKFRTMTDECDENGKLLPDEIRLTKFGMFLRNTSLDELPQLINIIKGDMSIIGPRALLVEYLPLYSAEQHRRHDVRPGLVGLAALHGRNDQTWDSKFQWDLYYVDNISFLMDMKIFLGAIKVTLSREGVNEEGNVTMSDFTGGKE